MMDFPLAALAQCGFGISRGSHKQIELLQAISTSHKAFYLLSFFQ